ncbi:L-rhamnose mutarotase [Microbacterium sp. 1.5R]|uniref:L-rhamnose mutarotase n=1 Tax=Microbacterium sp. 1.5R TaxID=1916917 RepID=UPI0011AAFDA2|nr:L-rhamnose mutarotase [Microbacterium sp. 1.5R]
MQRACFRLRVRPERMAEYRERHAAVWPDMLRALARSGWTNYSLFLAPDGLLIGYFESDDVEASVAAMGETEINTRWQADMAPFFADDGSGAGPEFLPSVFQLEQQLETLPIDDPERSHPTPSASGLENS